MEHPADATAAPPLCRYWPFLIYESPVRRHVRGWPRRAHGLCRLRGDTLTCFPSSSSSPASSSAPLWQLSVRHALISESAGRVTVAAADRTVHIWPPAEHLRTWTDVLRWAARPHRFDDYYDLGRLIGKGSHGDVRMCTERATGLARAVKVLPRAADRREAEYMRREVEVMKRVSHPCIVRTFDIFESATRLSLVMEFMQGGDLFEVIAADKTFSEAQAAAVMRQVLDAVQYLHANRIVHRDIKPENVLCSSKETATMTVKLTDFGFANFMDPRRDGGMTSLTGTPFFMAPEVILRKGHGAPADVFSCGVLAYTILSGRLPFDSSDGTNVFEMIVKGKVPFPDADWTGISALAKDFVRSLLHLDPARRPAASAALKHEWMSGSGALTGAQAATTCDRSNLRKLTSSSRLEYSAHRDEG